MKLPLTITFFTRPEGIDRIRLEPSATGRLVIDGHHHTSLIEEWMDVYLAHVTPTVFLPLFMPALPPFTRQVLEKLLSIPFGETMTYGEVAEQLGNPRAARAVGRACHVNPLPLVIPCHRVVGCSGELTGFRGGIEMKEVLLTHEGISHRSQRIYRQALTAGAC